MKPMRSVSLRDRSAIVSAGVFAGLAVILSACATSTPTEQKHRGFILDVENRQHVVNFPLGSIAIEDEERVALRNVVDELGPAEKQSVRLRASDLRGEARIEHVAEAFDGEDVDIHRQVEDGPFGEVRIDIEREIVRSTTCSQSVRKSRRVAGDLPIGCANDLALFEMVEDRMDLVRGRMPSNAPAARAAAIARAAEGRDVSGAGARGLPGRSVDVDKEGFGDLETPVIEALEAIVDSDLQP